MQGTHDLVRVPAQLDRALSLQIQSVSRWAKSYQGPHCQFPNGRISGGADLLSGHFRDLV